MVQTFFETYQAYRDSVYYDASAWSVAHFYNIKYKGVAKALEGERLTQISKLYGLNPLRKSNYAYAVNAQDYNIPALIQDMQSEKVVAFAAFKPFQSSDGTSFAYGSVVIPVALQTLLMINYL